MTESEANELGLVDKFGQGYYIATVDHVINEPQDYAVVFYNPNTSELDEDAISRAEIIGANPDKDDEATKRILEKNTFMHPLGIQHVVESPALVDLLEDWSAAGDEQKEEAEKKIAGLFNEEEVKVVFIPIPALEMAEEKRKELRKNLKAWNATHTLKCEYC